MIGLRDYINENYGLLYEAVRSVDMEKTTKLIRNLLNKKGITTYDFVNQYSVDGVSKYGMMCTNKQDEGAMFMWVVGNTAEIDSVIFTKDLIAARAAWAEGKSHSCDIEVEAKGASITKMCQLVIDVLTGGTKMNVKDMNEFIYDAQLYEGVEEDIVELINEQGLQELMKRKQALYMKIHNLEKKGKVVDQSLQDEFDDVKNQITAAKVNVKAKVDVKEAQDKDLQKWQEWLERECEANPEERFEDMLSNVRKVIRGIKPLALLCGAPGIGKTFRIMQTIKKEGLKMGEDYNLFKGSATPASLFTNLADFRKKGQIMVFDDCDAILKDPECINIMKAAYDSSDERWVSWNTSRAIVAKDQEAASEEPEFFDQKQKGDAVVWVYPQQFLYEGSGIVITNFSAGQLDTAIRNRAVICDLSFTNEECLQIIESIKDTIKPDIFPNDVKDKAIAYIRELINMKAPIKLSIRTFVSSCEEFYSSADERSIRRRIAQNLKLQALEGGKKY